MEEGKIGCNHLIIAGILTNPDYAKADFLAMNLEQHMRFDIQRHGKLPEQWEEYYKTVLIPLGIDGDDVKSGKTIIYTREGRVVGNYEDFAKLMKVKYNVSVSSPDDWIKQILEMHIEKAKMAIIDAKESSFNEKVDAFLKQRQDSMNNMTSIIAERKKTIEKAEIAMKEIDSIVAYLKPTTDTLYALHHYPVKEEEPEKEEGNEQAQDENNEEANEDPETQKPEEPEQKEEEAPKEEEPKEEEQPPKIEEEDAAEKPKEEEEAHEKPKEEEEVGEPDPEAVELQSKLHESFKLPELEAVKKLIEEGDKNGLSEFVAEIEALFKDAVKLVGEEKFKWKKFEKIILQMNEKSVLASNMLKISVISSEQLKIKAVETELDKYDNFIIDGVDKDVIEAAAIKFAATFRFV